MASLNSHALGAWQATGIPVIDIHELAAGKLAALLSRRKARDLFDSHRILHMKNLAPEQLRIAFVVYGAMNRKDWRTVSVNDVDVRPAELENQLIPTLRLHAMQETGEAVNTYGRTLLKECQQALSVVLPLKDTERTFLDLLLDKGEIDATILTTDTALQTQIQRQPLLEWKALNVRQYKGLS